MNPSDAKVRYAYARHEKRAAERGLGWEFTFESWVKVWADSGKWEQRGRHGHMFVMARHGDAGPYSPSNVEIKTHSQNSLERMQNYPVPRRKSTGFGFAKKGWCFHAGKRKPYQAKLLGKSLGYYATEEAARTVYLQAVAEAKEGLASRVQRKTGRRPAQVYELRRKQ